jgi:hypothetical protein
MTPEPHHSVLVETTAARGPADPRRAISCHVCGRDGYVDMWLFVSANRDGQFLSLS